MIVLDTHVWVWFVDDPGQLSVPARKAVEQALSSKGIYISSISAWEVALLVASGRLQLKLDVREWIRKSEALPFFHFVPVDNTLFVKSVFLPGKLHADPADRIIIATALSMGVPLISKDRRIRSYPGLGSVW